MIFCSFNAIAKYRVFLQWMLLSVLLPSTAMASDDVGEYDVVIHHLYVFGKFTEWPSDALNGPFNLCILGNAPFGNAFAYLHDKTIKGREVVIKNQPKPDELKRCQILFLSASEQAALPKILAQLSGLPILTVAEAEGALDQGVSINLGWDKNIIFFDVNKFALERSKLAIPSQMLKYARHVR